MTLIYYRNVCQCGENEYKSTEVSDLYGYTGRPNTESKGFNSNCSRKLFNCSKHVSGIV